jgi:aquaporin Z
MVVSLFVVLPTANSPVAPFIDWSVIGLVHAFVLFMLIQSLAVISGAHFNPAITVGLAAAKRFDWKDVPAYVVAQVVAAIVAAAPAVLVSAKLAGVAAPVAVAVTV